VTGIEDLVTRLIGENIVLTTSLAAELGAVGMDPSQVQQILLNLVLNARFCALATADENPSYIVLPALQ
jgi:nitrogen-specific signal transduction histidine kinase